MQDIKINDKSPHCSKRLLGDVFSNPYLMPSEYKGEYTKNGGLTKFQPRKWTEKEIEWVNMLKSKGFNTKQIAECIDRDATQVSIKIKRLGKKSMTYNQAHFEEKFAVNYDFVKEIKPKSVLDVYAGLASVYKKLNCENVISNDKNENSNTEYKLDALDFVCQMYIDKRKFDLVDLDPFGSAYDCFDLAIKMAKKGLKRNTTTNSEHHENMGGVYGGDFSGIIYPKTVLHFDTVNNRSKDRKHSTQKPVDLCEYLIKTYTNEGETVLDNCAGSGTTGIACINTNRNYILIEKEQKYFDIINERIYNHTQKKRSYENAS